MRLSLTEVCNFRCTYCLPDGYIKRAGRPSELTLPEIERAVRAFAALGLWKVRLTGGEPTVRKDFDEIARAVAAVPGVRRVAMTTNGWRLAENARTWREAGVSAVNVSVDLLDPAKFAAVTGHDRLPSVIAGIEAASAAGFDSVKVNAVLMRGVNDDELEAMIEFVRSRDISLRFIEVMRTNDNPAFFADRHVAGEAVTERSRGGGLAPPAARAGRGPRGRVRTPASERPDRYHRALFQGLLHHLQPASVELGRAAAPVSVRGRGFRSSPAAAGRQPARCARRANSGADRNQGPLAPPARGRQRGHPAPRLDRRLIVATQGPDAATIEVELCGKLADLHGSSVALSIPREGCTAGILLARAAAAFPGLSSLIAEGRVRVCVNEAVVSEGAAVAPEDRVALFPPVSGG